MLMEKYVQIITKELHVEDYKFEDECAVRVFLAKFRDWERVKYIIFFDYQFTDENGEDIYYETQHIIIQ